MIIDYKKTPKKITFTSDECLEGITLCLKNSVRLNKNAEILLQSENSSITIVYSLWSLALEEYGRALILFEKLRKNSELTFNYKKLFDSHENKFNSGKNWLKELPKNIIFTFKVQSNVRDKELTLIRNTAGTITIAPSTTGEFSGFTENITVALRFQSLYIGIDENTLSWNHPDLFSYEGIKSSLFSSDIQLCIEKLSEGIAKLESEVQLFKLRSTH